MPEFDYAVHYEGGMGTRRRGEGSVRKTQVLCDGCRMQDIPGTVQVQMVISYERGEPSSVAWIDLCPNCMATAILELQFGVVDKRRWKWMSKYRLPERARATVDARLQEGGA